MSEMRSTYSTGRFVAVSCDTLIVLVTTALWKCLINATMTESGQCRQFCRCL